MRNASNFHDDYLAALVQLSKQPVTVKTKAGTFTVFPQAINGVRIAEQIVAEQKERQS